MLKKAYSFILLFIPSWRQLKEFSLLTMELIWDVDPLCLVDCDLSINLLLK